MGTLAQPILFFLTKKEKPGFVYIRRGVGYPPLKIKNNKYLFYSEGVRSQIGIPGEGFSFFVGKKKYGLGQGLPASPWPGPKASQPGPGSVNVQPKMSVRDQIIKTVPNRIQNRRFCLK